MVMVALGMVLLDALLHEQDFFAELAGMFEPCLALYWVRA